MPPPPLPSAALMVPALRGACASTRAALSSSSFNVRVDTGEHLFKIRGYSLLDQVVPNRGSIQSTKLRAGDFNWRFHFFPMDPNFFTVDLKLLDHGVMATAAYRVSILDVPVSRRTPAPSGRGAITGSSREGRGSGSALDTLSMWTC